MNSPRATGTIAAGTVVALSALYFAQGLPYGFFTGTVPVVLRRSGYSLTEISATGLLFASWWRVSLSSGWGVSHRLGVPLVQ